MASPSSSKDLRLDALLIALTLTPRLLFFAPEIDSWDSVDFALGLHAFDLTLYQPHFPGYPVLLFFAKLFSLLGFTDAVALSLPGLIALPLSLVALRRALSPNGQLSALSAALLVSSLPIVMLFSVRPMSDALGLSLLLATFAAGLRRRWFWCGALLGLALGVRLSYFPFVLSMLFLSGIIKTSMEDTRETKQALLGLTLGIAMWLLPLLFLQGPSSLFQEGLRFVGGHFTRWGGAVDEDTDWAKRGQMLLWNFWAYGLGGLWPQDGLSLARALSSLSLSACLIGAARALRVRELRRFLLIAFVPYALWVCLGQNPESPRHMMPLLALLVGVAGYELRALGLVCALGISVVSVPLLQEQSVTSAPQAALARFVAQSAPEARFYGWKTTRVMKYYAPRVESMLMKSLPLMVEDLSKNPTSAPVLFESKLTERRRRDRCFEVVESFRRSRYIEPAYASLTLFRDCGVPPSP